MLPEDLISQGGATPMQAKWIKLDLVNTQVKTDEANFDIPLLNSVNFSDILVHLRHFNHL